MYLQDEKQAQGGIAVSALTLSHFRSHRAARLTLREGPVVITGPNGAGKTSLLEAVSLLSPGRGLRAAGLDEIARKPEGLGWKVTATLHRPDMSHEVETWAEPGEGRQVRIDGKAAAQSGLGRIARVLWLVPAMDRLWIEGAEGRRRFLDRVTLSFLPDHAEAALAYDKAMRDRNRLLREQNADPVWHGVLEAQMGAAGAAVIANRAAALDRLAAVPDAASGAFPRADLAVTYPEDVPPAGADDLSAALAAGRRRDMAAGRTLIGPHRADLSAVYAAKGMAAAQCSTGEQKALLVSLILANARAVARQDGAAPILLMDEIAAHLDAGRRAALYAEIVEMKAQALMTGTGRELFDGLLGQAQVLAVAESGSLSQVSEERA
jgi:DNA replication and repair protein RecF